MIAAAIHICAIVLACTAGLLIANDWVQQPSFRTAILAAGLIGGAAVVVSGFLVLDSWSELMEHVDFAKLDHPRPKRLPSGLYFAPSMTTALGAAATFVFGRLLYRHVRQLG